MILTTQKKNIYIYDLNNAEQCSNVYMCISICVCTICVFLYVYVHCFLGIVILITQNSARIYIYVYFSICVYIKCVSICVCTLWVFTCMYVHCFLGITILTNQQSAQMYICVFLCVGTLCVFMCVYVNCFLRIPFLTKQQSARIKNFNDDAVAWCWSTGWVFSVSHLCIDTCTFSRAGDDAENCEILLVAQGGAVPSCKLLREVPQNRFCVFESFLCVWKIVSVFI